MHAHVPCGSIDCTMRAVVIQSVQQLEADEGAWKQRTVLRSQYLLHELSVVSFQ